MKYFLPERLIAHPVLHLATLCFSEPLSRTQHVELTQPASVVAEQSGEEGDLRDEEAAVVRAVEERSPAGAGGERDGGGEGGEGRGRRRKRGCRCSHGEA